MNHNFLVDIGDYLYINRRIIFFIQPVLQIFFHIAFMMVMFEKTGTKFTSAPEEEFTTKKPPKFAYYSDEDFKTLNNIRETICKKLPDICNNTFSC